MCNLPRVKGLGTCSEGTLIEDGTCSEVDEIWPVCQHILPRTDKLRSSCFVPHASFVKLRCLALRNV